MISKDEDVTPHTERIETFPQRILIAATDTGQLLRGQLEDLQKLIDAYHNGVLVETYGGRPARF
jgi:fructose-1,6-bisphosphatase